MIDFVNVPLHVWVWCLYAILASLCAYLVERLDDTMHILQLCILFAAVPVFIHGWKTDWMTVAFAILTGLVSLVSALYPIFYFSDHMKTDKGDGGWEFDALMGMIFGSTDQDLSITAMQHKLAEIVITSAIHIYLCMQPDWKIEQCQIYQFVAMTVAVAVYGKNKWIGIGNYEVFWAGQIFGTNKYGYFLAFEAFMYKQSRLVYKYVEDVWAFSSAWNQFMLLLRTDKAEYNVEQVQEVLILVVFGFLCTTMTISGKLPQQTLMRDIVQGISWVWLFHVLYYIIASFAESKLWGFSEHVKIMMTQANAMLFVTLLMQLNNVVYSCLALYQHNLWFDYNLVFDAIPVINTVLLAWLFGLPLNPVMFMMATLISHQHVMFTGPSDYF